jgi:hypothetical protein
MENLRVLQKQNSRNFMRFQADVVEFVAAKALKNNSEPQLSIAWPQRIQSKAVIFRRSQ